MPIMAYFLGSISSAIIVAKLMGLGDPRDQGSGNPGATNILRLGGKKAAIVTLLGDLMKGLIPILITKAVTDNQATLALVAIAAFLGHLYPVFFNFEGGKGVATTFGVCLGLSLTTSGLLLVTWLIVALLSRYSSLAALIASAFSPLYAWYFGLSVELIVAMLLIAIMLFWRHRDNIARIIAGKESKINLAKKG